MLIRKKHIIRHYTIVEVMVAMGIFLVMMTIMMQFFTSAQKVWNLASKKNMMYADARVAMNLMTRELQSMLYNNDAADSTSTYPFWYQWEAINADGETRTEVDEYFVTNGDMPELGSTAKPYLTALNFISTTDIKTVDEGSDVCEIRYKFVPVYFEGSTPYTFNSVKGGKLVRSCVAEYSATSTQSLAVDYNFADCYYRGATPGTGTGSAAPWDERVYNIWKDSSVNPDPTPFQTVISGVYSLRFTCYFWNLSSGKLDIIEAMDSSGKNISGDPITSPLTYNLAMGTPKPVAVRIDMKLVDSKDLRKLAFNIYVANDPGSTTSEKKAAKKQIRVLKQTMRTFSKVIYLGKR